MQNTLRVNNYSSGGSLHPGLLSNRRVAILGITSGVDTTTHERIGVLGASDTGTGVFGTSDTGTGVLGRTTGQYGTSVGGLASGSDSQGVLGFSSGVNGQGVNARAPGTFGRGIYGYGGKYGAELGGGVAPLRLEPSATAGAPTTGAHLVGELVVSSDGHLWFCRTSGTPGKWVRLDLSSTFVALVQK